MKKDSLKPYEIDASQLVGKTAKVFLPKNIKELQEIVKQNNSLNIRAGGTGLAGGAVPQGEKTLDISKIDKIVDFNNDKKTIVVETGIILDDLQDFLAQYNLEFPINPSSHSICTIGGMISTNAVGNRAIKYGRTSDWVLWIDVVNPDGKIERKNKTELMDFSGMEGITGIIVRACLKLTQTKERTGEIIYLEDYNEVLKKVRELKRISEVSMIELLGKSVTKDLFSKDKYALTIEFESDQGKIKQKEFKKLLNMRDSVGPKLSQEGHTILEDPRVMTDKSDTLVSWFEKNNIPFFGHLGVGIFHPRFSKDNEDKIPEMMKIVKKLNGQITGEHGIGILKKEFVDPSDKKLLLNMKKRLDPLNKFNPGKIL
jgi:glycolate oxidase